MSNRHRLIQRYQNVKKELEAQQKLERINKGNKSSKGRFRTPVKIKSTR
jgi:hypothetical protein